MEYKVNISRVWPSDLPLPKVSFDETVLYPLYASDREFPIRFRRNPYRTRFKEISVEWIFSADQLETFKTFFCEDLYSGVAPFVIPLKVESSQESLKEWVVRFKGGYRVERDESKWKVTATLFLVYKALLERMEPPLSYQYFCVSLEGTDEFVIFLVTQDGTHEPFFVKEETEGGT